MAFEVVSAGLIRQVQIALRNDAGLSTYDPHDPILPPLPSLDASIAEHDPLSPENLRCKRCNAKFLGGTNSSICIYCGTRRQNIDVIHDPISFNSTFGCQWLLQSLKLDESETVEQCTKEFELNRAQRRPKQEISLHDFLDLQITWPHELEKPEAIVTNKILEQSSSTLNLRDDVENTSLGSQRDPFYRASEEPDKLKQISAGKEILSLPSSVPSADSAVRMCEDNRGVAISRWAADFHVKHEDYPHKGSIVESSSQVVSLFGSGQEDDTRPAMSMTYDLMHDDLWKDANSKVAQEAERFDSSVEAINGSPQDISKNLSSEGVDLLDNQCKSNTSELCNMTINGHGDTFDESNRFTSSICTQDTSGNAW